MLCFGNLETSMGTLTSVCSKYVCALVQQPSVGDRVQVIKSGKSMSIHREQGV